MRCPYCGFIINASPCSQCNETVIGIEWTKWSESFHSDPNQIKRQISAGEWAGRPFDIDKKSCTAIFTGSGKDPYKTTLLNCTCADFRQRKLPCKHMYRLAYELGIFKLSSSYTPYDAVRFDISGHTDDDIHDGFRISELNFKTQSAFINSNKVNLHECECEYYTETGNVCSHIIQLAILFGVIGDRNKKGHLWD